MKLIFYTDLRLSNRKLAPLHMASSKSWKKLLALPAVQVRRKKAFQKAARAGQSRSEVRPAVTETTCAQWRAGCFNLVVGMGEASGSCALSTSTKRYCPSPLTVSWVCVCVCLCGYIQFCLAVFMCKLSISCSFFMLIRMFISMYLCVFNLHCSALRATW